MVVQFAHLVSELKTLRKGRGLFVGQISDRIGPAIRQACSIDEGDEPAEIRRKVAEWLENLTVTLPSDLRISALAAFGIDREARFPFYQDRVRWAADRIGRDDRSVRRRIDEAIDRIAERAVAATGSLVRDGHPLRWHTQELRVALAIDRPGLEVIEFRRIVADDDGIDEVDLAWSVNAAEDHGGTPDDLSFDVFFGGTLVRRRRESTARVGLALSLARRLDVGQAHEFMVRYRLMPGRSIQPHFVCVPRHQCDWFDLHVRFDTERRPHNVQRIAELFQRDVTDPMVTGEVVEVDTAGEVHATFHQLTAGLAYGLRWND
jgi:hypothetical protein